ncbi:hypothetical protein BDZ45DRAFT_740564 [Acephala macrosclerotiorum]|nr:hypothetical protein BDZ45DRAFT_740564 [Acephala macrosclerotiorum]
MADHYAPPLSPYDPVYPAESPSALRKARQRQDSLGAIEQSRYPTIESRANPEHQNKLYNEPPAAGYKVADWDSTNTNGRFLSVEDLERPQTPMWNNYEPEQIVEKSKQREYQSWHMQFTPLARPAGAGCYPQCPRLFDSRHWKEFERPEGKKIRCEDCKELLGYYRYEVDVYRGPDRNGRWRLWSDYE